MAGNVIDTMVLVLGLDASKFSQQQRDALDLLRKFEEEGRASAIRTESHQKRLTDTLVNFKREFVGTVAGLLGGTAAHRVIEYITNLDAATGRLAHQMSVSAPILSAWQGAIQQVGGSAAEADSALRTLSGEVQQFNLTGQSSMLGVLGQLRVSMFRNGKTKTRDELLRDISGAVQGRPAPEASALLSMIPGMNQGMVNLLLEGPAALDRRLAAARTAGSTTKESAEIAQKYQESAAQFERSVTNFGRAISVFALPAFVKFVDWMTNLFSSTPDQGTTSTDNLRKRFGAPPAWAESTAAAAAEGSWLSTIFNSSGWRTAGTIGAAVNPVTAPGWWLGQKMREGGAAPASAGDPSNMSRFLSGLSFLETDQRNVGNSKSSASGYFQFTTGTARDARSAGIADPRFGSYDDQAASTEKFIRTFHPAAAAAIERGDFAAAEAMLKGRWPSLPGGSQPQQASRYDTYRSMLAGRPGAAGVAGGGAGGGSTTTTLHVDKVEVNAPLAKDAEGIGREIVPALRRSLQAGSANVGAE